MRPSLRATGSRECAPDDGLREAIHGAASGELDCFVAYAPRNDGQRTQLHDIAARSARIMQKLFALENRGRREDRVRAAPAVSCAMCTKKCAHEHTGSAESIRPSLRNGFTAYNAPSPVTGFVATVAGGILPANLTPASGRQDHTTSPYAETTFVFVTSASTASHRAFRDDREPPLVRVRRAESNH
jgi:hypothetical protein